MDLKARMNTRGEVNSVYKKLLNLFEFMLIWTQMYVIFRHRYNHRNKHRCRNKVNAVKERTHRILYWFGVTLHPVPHN